MINTAEQGEQAGSQTEWVWKQTGKDSTSPPQSLQTSHGETEACLHSAAKLPRKLPLCPSTHNRQNISIHPLRRRKTTYQACIILMESCFVCYTKMCCLFFFFPQRFPGARAVCVGLWHMLPRYVLPIKLMTGWITLVLNLIFSEIGLRRINKTPSSNS